MEGWQKFKEFLTGWSIDLIRKLQELKWYNHYIFKVNIFCQPTINKRNSLLPEKYFKFIKVKQKYQPS